MSQRYISARLLTTTALLLVGGGLVGSACGTDDRNPSVVDEENPLNPTPGTGNGNGAGSGGAATTPPPAPGTGGTTPVSAGGSESQPGNIPVDPGQPDPAGPGPSTPPAPPGTALAPNCDPPEGAVPALTLELVSDGLEQPLFVTGVPGDDTRLFVLEKAGRVRVIVNGVLQEQPFLDIGSLVVNSGERGMLGLAFHPNYAQNGLFYVHHSSVPENNDGVTAEYKVDPTNPNLADPNSRRLVLRIANDPEANHNGGDLVFGPDKFLYLGMGDGGGGNDQHGTDGNGQNLNALFGKMLRIDVDGRDVNGAYGIPPGNLAEQTAQQALPEIWAYGLRNPWRYSFDACTGDLYIGDVGQNTLEEVDFLAANTPAGTNFGWRLMEGPNCRTGDTVCPTIDTSTLKLPVDSYPRTVGTSITGGYVYRGSAVPGLRGRYFYADYDSNDVFSFRIENGLLVDRQDVSSQIRPSEGGTFGGIASFGTDNAGEVYVAAFQPGAIYRIAAAP
jgi:glucose/arabinose dehydrogenase